MWWMWLASILLTAVLGFLAGYLTFRRSLAWCPEHGTVKACELCRPAQMLAGTPRH
jgi:hypothetical protein